MLIISKTKIGAGIQHILTGRTDLLVNKGVTVESTADDAIFVVSGRHKVTIAGDVISGADDAVDMEDALQAQTVIVTATGRVIAEDDAIVLGGDGTSLVNRGTIAAGFSGVSVDTAGDSRITITNFGTINGTRNGVNVFGDGTLVLHNKGAIFSEDEGYDGSGQRDIVINTGIIQGTVTLNSGNDIYDGRGGRVIGDILGGFDEDTFRPGKGAESIDGEEGVDLLDFRSGGAVKVALDGSFANAGGAARGDVYTGIEHIAGSLTGADFLQGDIADNRIRGNGGNDTINGGNGNDTVIGGGGKDLLSGGVGFDFDVFVFDKLSDAGDRITDYVPVLDTIRIDMSGFGISLPTGTLPSGRFHASTTRQADDAQDRFIFRTGDETLWFDRDGTKAAFKPVLVADLQDGVTLTAADIFLFS
jgi:Ca2+-binding RTX toxin-like protein